MTAGELISQVSSGIVQIAAEKDREWIGHGSAFLVSDGIVTCSHNIRSREIDVLAIRFDDFDPNSPDDYLRVDPDDIVAAESPEEEGDYAYLRIHEPEFENRHRFEFSDSSVLSVGDQVLFLRFPFGLTHLTSHIGYVSSLHEHHGFDLIQIDGSVNGGNSGGPLIHVETGEVVGIVTRALTGFVVEQFDQLIEALKRNQAALQATQGLMTIKKGGVSVDPMDALRASHAAMEQIAKSIRRSANVGIGIAYSSNYVRDAIAQVESG